VWAPLAFYIGKVVGATALLVFGRRQIGGPLRILFVHVSLFAVLTDTAVSLPSVLTIFAWTGSAGGGALMPGFECMTSSVTYETKFFVVCSLPALLAV
jgi:hypothetical protein